MESIQIEVDTGECVAQCFTNFEALIQPPRCITSSTTNIPNLYEVFFFFFSNDTQTSGAVGLTGFLFAMTKFWPVLWHIPYLTDGRLGGLPK